MNSKLYNIYPQTGMSFISNFNISNNFFSGTLNFINSGNDCLIRIENGKIKNIDNEFISSLNKNGNCTISGNLSNNNFNFFLDNKLIYAESKNYGLCSGISFISHNNDSNFSLSIYGDRPNYLITNELDELYSLQSIPCFVSGYGTNLGNFKIYSINIGGTLNANLGNSSYVPNNFFEISGENKWDNGLTISPGQVYKFNINQKFNFETFGEYTYIPLYIETDFGTIYKRFFVKINSLDSIERVLLKTEAFDFNENEFFKNIEFSIKTSVVSPKQNSKDFLIYISGLEGNNNKLSILDNQYIDTFTGSWNINMEQISFYPKIIKSGGINMFDSTNSLSNNTSKSGIYYEYLTGITGSFTGHGITGYLTGITGISGIEKNQIFINSGFYNGIVFDVPYIYNSYYNITGINFGIYSLGYFTGARNNIIRSGISGGYIGISIYELDKFNRLTNQVASQNFNISGINDPYFTGIDNFNIYKIKTNYPIYTSKKYAFVISGYSSGYLYNYKLFIPTGNLDYINNNINYLNNISGQSEYIGILPSETGIGKLPFLQILGEHVTDDNILYGSGTLDFSEQNIYNIYINKIYNFLDSNIFTGSALFYLSGFSGLERSGILSVYHNDFRQLSYDSKIF